MAIHFIQKSVHPSIACDGKISGARQQYVLVWHRLVPPGADRCPGLRGKYSIRFSMSRRRVASRREHKKGVHSTCTESSSIQPLDTYTPAYVHTCTCRRVHTHIRTHNVGPRRRTAIAHTRAHARDKPRRKIRAQLTTTKTTRTTLAEPAVART